tara:strand:+ start:20892 stop:21998 length:1107 start_codon:yes stop_codon:yes gene_type:complete
MATIKDIAKEACVSEGTVDRVIHNRGGVSKITEAKIKKILKHHNFSVNPIASALAMKNKYYIATLIPKFKSSDLFWESPYLGVKKATENVKSIGVTVQNFDFNQYKIDSYLKGFDKLLKTNPTAVIIVPYFSEQTKIIAKKLEDNDIPYIFLNIDVKGFNNISYIGQNSIKAGQIVGKLMCLLATKPKTTFLIIQAVHHNIKNNTVSKRIDGFCDYISNNDSNYNILTLKVEDLNNTKDTKKRISSYLYKHPEVHGIFVPSSRISRVVECLEEKLLKKINLIGFDNTPQNVKCLLDDSVSFLISQRPFDQGYEAILMMCEFLTNKIKSPTRIYMPIDILTKENVIYNSRKEFNKALFNETKQKTVKNS